MIANYHTHTVRCHHAVGSERDFVEKAIENGMQELGFADHCPYLFPGDYYSNYRMYPEQLEGYCDTILALKKEYADQINIRLGLEVEYYPRLFEKTLHFFEEYPIEYLLLGQHFLDNEYDKGVYSGTRPLLVDSLLQKYVDQSIEAMETGKFFYFAHPDLMCYTGNQEVYDTQYRRLIRCAHKNGLPLEINMLGIWDNRHYPDERFWKLVGEEGASVIIGADAHNPERLIVPAAEERAMELVRKYGLKLVERMP